jgi:O-acetyl-ADP-ribose deacetylase (regulator of RNase III)
MKTIPGDILEVKRGIIIHQVNCRKICGGLAGALRRKFPFAFDNYFRDERPEEKRIGTILLGEQWPQLFVCHLFGQDKPGANTDLKAVEQALESRQELLKNMKLPLFAPYKIGCGLGGGDWNAYKTLLKKYLPTLTIIKKD